MPFPVKEEPFENILCTYEYFVSAGACVAIATTTTTSSYLNMMMMYYWFYFAHRQVSSITRFN